MQRRLGRFWNMQSMRYTIIMPVGLVSKNCTGSLLNIVFDRIYSLICVFFLYYLDCSFCHFLLITSGFHMIGVVSFCWFLLILFFSLSVMRID